MIGTVKTNQEFIKYLQDNPVKSPNIIIYPGKRWIDEWDKIEHTAYKYACKYKKNLYSVACLSKQTDDLYRKIEFIDAGANEP